ncbi:hypothetical protein PMAYCL1PPCAC_29818, partial [Pristionchus mayeri]
KMRGWTPDVGMNQKLDEDASEDGQYGEQWINCCVDSCRKNTPLSKVKYLPLENVLEGIEMILSCKTRMRVQNYLMQRYLEGQHLAKRNNERATTDWTCEIPFRVCYRHFSSSGKLVQLPKVMNTSVNPVLELKRRESLFYMYGVEKEVEYPSVTGVDHSLNTELAAMICDVPGCGNTPITMDASRCSHLRLFSNPIEMSLRREWERAIGSALGHYFLLKNTGFICEKHFPNRGKIVDGVTELPVLINHSLAAFRVNRMLQQRMAESEATRDCMVRCCPITSKSIKRDRSLYELFHLPNGEKGERWMDAIRQADPHFSLMIDCTQFVCERHFITEPSESRTSFPILFLGPAEAAMNRIGKTIDSHQNEEVCRCCRDVEMCYDILRRFNSKMNTLMQHVNMLCVLEGVKEAIPRPFDDTEDDAALYGDSDKTRVIAGVRAASMFVREARGEVSTMKRTLDAMRPSTSRCVLPSCHSPTTKIYKMVNWKNLENDLKIGALKIGKEDVDEIRRLFTKGIPVNLCENHWRDEETHCDSHGLEEECEEVKRLKKRLAVPLDFQPSYRKRRRIDVSEKDGGEGASRMVQVEVNDDEEEDERLLSNNELLQRLLGGAIAGQVTGEINDDGEVYEGEGANTDEAGNHDETAEDEGEDGKEEKGAH